MSGETATERVETALAKAHSTQDTINAFISLDDERALERAGEIDERLARGEDVGPLAGVPIALKDLIDHKGRVTTCGSAFYSETAATTADCIRRLEDVGAVVIGRANLHEFAFGFNSENEHWGPVRNPWHRDTSAGGSSGGSGAAVAAGITPIAIGTDTGGSVRVPAALCGAFGLKVTYGRISLDGVFPLVADVDTVGPIANSMENIDVSYRTMSGDHSPEPDRAPRRIGIPEPWYDEAPLADDVRSSFEGTLAALRDLGHEVHPIQMPDIRPNRQGIVAAMSAVADVHREFREKGMPYGSDVDTRIAAEERVTDEEKAKATEWQKMVRQRFSDALATVDFVLTPTCPVREKFIGRDMIGERHHIPVLSYFTSLVNQSLHPALAMPIAHSGAPPASLHAIADLDSERDLVALGRWLEDEGVVGFTSVPVNSPTADTG